MALKNTPKIPKEDPFQLPDWDMVKAEIESKKIKMDDDMEEDESGETKSKTGKQDFRLDWDDKIE